MVAAGLFDEARRLRQKYGELGRTAKQAVGYGESFAFLDGVLSRAEAVHKVTIRTRQFARRQLTWYRALKECRFIPRNLEDTPSALARRIVAAASTTAPT
jgi:tRNA dimethylallyltransferase